MDPAEQHSEQVESARARADSGRDIPESVGVADLRQKLLLAALRSSNSALIVPATTPPKSASNGAPEKGLSGQELDGSQAHLRLPARGRCDRVVHIEEIQARLDNDAALAELLATVPVPHSVGPLLHQRFFGRKWDIAHQTDYWLASDGATAVFLKISGASASAVARMRMRFDDLRISSPELQPSGKTLRHILAIIAREDDGVAKVSVEARSSGATS